MAKGPAKTFKFGSITVNVWEKENKKNPDWGPSISYQLSKSFKDPKTDEWRNQDFYFNRVDEMLCAIMGLQMALEDRYLKKQGNPATDDFLDGI